MYNVIINNILKIAIAQGRECKWGAIVLFQTQSSWPSFSPSPPWSSSPNLRAWPSSSQPWYITPFCTRMGCPLVRRNGYHFSRRLLGLTWKQFVRISKRVLVQWHLDNLVQALPSACHRSTAIDLVSTKKMRICETCRTVGFNWRARWDGRARNRTAELRRRGIEDLEWRGLQRITWHTTWHFSIATVHGMVVRASRADIWLRADSTSIAKTWAQLLLWDNITLTGHPIWYNMWMD